MPELWGDFLLCDLGLTTRHQSEPKLCDQHTAVFLLENITGGNMGCGRIRKVGSEAGLLLILGGGHQVSPSPKGNTGCCSNSLIQLLYLLGKASGNQLVRVMSPYGSLAQF